MGARTKDRANEKPAPRAVLLDLWHTLFFLEPEDEERYREAQLKTMARVFESWPPSPRGRHPAIHDAGQAAREVRAESVEAAQRGVSMPLATQAVHAARRLGRRARPVELAQALEELVSRFRFQPTPGALDAIRILHERGLRLGVVSNSVGEPGEALQRQLDRLGMAMYFRAWALSDQLPWTKPAPEIFWHCLAMLGVPRDRAVHVGDAWFDLVGARAAGLRAGIWFTGARAYAASYGEEIGADRPELRRARYQVGQFDRLPELVDRLLPV